MNSHKVNSPLNPPPTSGNRTRQAPTSSPSPPKGSGRAPRKGHVAGREDGMLQKPMLFNGSGATAEQASECEEVLEVL